jgi:hypothetical protein
MRAERNTLLHSENTVAATTTPKVGSKGKSRIQNEAINASGSDGSTRKKSTDGSASSDDSDVDDANDVEIDEDQEEDPATQIDWSPSPQRPVQKRLNELPPDSSPPLSSCMPETSPIEAHRSVRQTDTIQIRSSVNPYSPKTTRQEVISRPATTVAQPNQARRSLPAQPNWGTPNPTPQVANGRPARFLMPAKPNAAAYKTQLTFSSSVVPSSFASNTQKKRESLPNPSINTKRPAEEAITTGSSKKRDLGITFNFTQDTPVPRDPNRHTNDMKKQFINAQPSKRSVSAAEPTSSRVPETQFTPKAPQQNAVPKQFRLPGSAKGTASNKVKTAGVPVQAGVNSIDNFQIFKGAYPQYTGDLKHFIKLCKQLQTVQSTFPRILWDDFIVRHKIEYLPYATECLEEGEQPTPYVEFCNEYDVQYGKKIMTPAMIRQVASS